MLFNEKYNGESKERISVIEGPPPTFEQVSDESWPLRVVDVAQPVVYLLTRLQAPNNKDLAARCKRARENQQTTMLYFTDLQGLKRKLPIEAARPATTPDGFRIIILWFAVRDEWLEGLDLQ